MMCTCKASMKWMISVKLVQNSVQNSVQISVQNWEKLKLFKKIWNCKAFGLKVFSTCSPTQKAIYMLKIGISNTIAKVPYQTIREILAKICHFFDFFQFWTGNCEKTKQPINFSIFLTCSTTLKVTFLP